jgi:hypothetical protein
MLMKMAHSSPLEPMLEAGEFSKRNLLAIPPEKQRSINIAG